MTGMKLRYTGEVPTTFLGGDGFTTGEVAPGATFDVPDEQGRRFLQHGLVEPADKAAKALYAQMTAPPVEDSGGEGTGSSESDPTN